MGEKISVGILGATGMVGQNYIRLLKNHPWFKVSFLAASPNSAGMKFAEAVHGRWQMADQIPNDVSEIIVEDVANVKSAAEKCRIVFSAFETGDKETVKKMENDYAAAGIGVFSNASAHRWTEDVPMLIPEINWGHLKMIEIQKKNRGYENGFIIVKPNCSLQSYLTPIYALINAGFDVKKIILTTMQAVSGAGYPGVASLDVIDNVVPFIAGEEEKTELEPYKILGRDDIKISAHCNRVPVVDGHTACVSVLFGDKKPSPEEIVDVWKSFRSRPQELDLPSAPLQPIIYMSEENRPQPRKDRDNDKGMAVCVGRLRKCNVFDFKFVGLSHNTVRGAAGGGILNAELAFKEGLYGFD